MIPGVQGIYPVIGASAVGPTSYGSHPYWRVFATNNHGGSSFIEIGEVDFLDISGADIPTVGGTVIFSSVAIGNDPANGFDGSSTTSWIGDSTTDEWLGYHYPSGVSVERVSVTTRNGGADPIRRFPKDCKLQYSDDELVWADAFAFSTTLPVLGYAQVFPYSPPASGFHRGWRLYCDNNNGGSSFITIDALEFRATSGGADQTNGAAGSALGNTLGRAVWSSHAIASEGYNCFTDNGSLWHGNSTTNQWCGFYFPAPVKFEEISITAPAGTPTRAPKDMHIQYTDEGDTWTTQKSLAQQTGWAAGETRVLPAI